MGGDREGAGCGLPTDGDLTLEFVPNGFAWVNMSAEMVAVVDRIREDTDVYSASILVYLCDGKVPNLPVAKRAPKDKTKGYAKPYWLPVTFRVKAGR
jgi:hypothetical protein